jgi:AraC-like DNA-binding protein
LPMSAVQTYSGPGEAEAAYTATEVELTPTGRTPFWMRVVRVEFENLWLHQVHESGPRTKHAAQMPARAFVKFLTTPGQELVTQGVTLPYQGILRHSHGHCYYDRTSDAVHWAAISMPVEQLVAAGIAIGGCDLAPVRNLSIIVPPTEAMVNLRAIHATVTALAERAPSVLAVPEVAHRLEQSLVEVLVGCLSQSATQEAGWAHQCHEAIMRRFYCLLEDNPKRPVYVPEICAAIRVPERTLRLCCQEHLGMSPKQYLMQRRMQQARRVLGAAIAGETTVTEIATHFGFWHFGRFAGTYQSIFGELPSVTLHRPPH